MAYSIHIERADNPINIEEWTSAVNSLEGARINQSNTEAVNSITGQDISIGASEGNVAISFKTGGFLGFGKKKTWETCITFFDGRGSFNASRGIEMPSNPIRQTASKLASSLGARIVGDEGEEYEW